MANLEKIKIIITNQKKNVCGEIETLRENFNRDYIKFLQNDSDNLYKLNQMLRNYNELLEVIENHPEEVKFTIKHNIEHWTDDLLYGSLQKNTNNFWVNRFHILDLEVKQYMIKQYKK